MALKEPRRPNLDMLSEPQLSKQLRKLRRNKFLARVGLVTLPAKAGTTVIDVPALMDLSHHCASAVTATHQGSRLSPLLGLAPGVFLPLQLRIVLLAA
jgi:hypothetical protein